MAILGGRDSEEKLLAAENASIANVTAHVFGFVSVATAAALSPFAAGFGIAAAGVALWGAVQRHIADDPPRADWNTFAPPLPPRIRVVRSDLTDGNRSTPRYLVDWTSALTAHGYCLAAAITCAERLAGLREGLEPEIRESTWPWNTQPYVSYSDVQRALGRMFNLSAGKYSDAIQVKRLPKDHVGPRRILDLLDLDPEQILTETPIEELNRSTVEALSRYIPRIRRSFGFPAESWQLMDPNHALDHPLTSNDVQRATDAGTLIVGEGLLFGMRSGRVWSIFD